MKAKIIGVLVTLHIHALVFLLLYFLVLPRPDRLDEESSVVLGEFEAVDGEGLVMTEVEVVEQPSASMLAQNTAEDVITQDDEETVVIPTENKTVKTKKKVKTQDKAKEEQDRKAREEAEEKKRKQQEFERVAYKASSDVAKAFASGKNGGGGGGQNDTDEKLGNPNGNSNVGILADVNGRTPMDMQRPEQMAKNIEGVIVVNVTVKPDGRVENPTINVKKTTIGDPTLRNAALKAAGGSKFNAIPGGVDKVDGTITYKYKH
jgi:TonB family protein